MNNSIDMVQGIANQVNQWANMAQKFNNPQAICQQVMSNNPQMAQVQEILRNGMDPKQFALNLMQQKGINPTQLMSMINSTKF